MGTYTDYKGLAGAEKIIAKPFAHESERKANARCGHEFACGVPGVDSPRGTLLFAARRA
jgi:hypothetical protein